jgi:hypothetical protein
MQLDFWNNPIVVSAFRVKYRRGGLFNGVALYLLLLTAGGAVLFYYNDVLGGSWPWARKYFVGLLTLQFIVSTVIAASTTSTSMRSEVANRTLDFQRIAALSPRQILLGKLLGEPALAYLLAIATFPLATWCVLLGGVTPEVMALMYLNLATTTLLAGAVGLLNRVDLPIGKADSGMAALAGLLTPVPVFSSLVSNDPWQRGVPFFGVTVPFLLVIPVAQAVLACLFFQTMVRRLLNPLNPALGKRLAYALLFAVDVVTAAWLYDPLFARGPQPWLTLEFRAGAFCLIHLLASLCLIVGVTPWRETVHSWVWRFRDRLPRLWDLWVSDRSENALALLTFCALGVLCLGLFVVLPTAKDQDWRVVVPPATAMVLLLLTFGTLHQCCVLLAGRSGTVTVFLLGMILVVLPHLVGRYYQLDLLLAVSPSAQFVRWLAYPTEKLNLLPLLVLYGLLLAGAWLALRRWMRRLAQVVDHKLQRMGVTKPLAPWGRGVGGEG